MAAPVDYALLQELEALRKTLRHQLSRSDDARAAYLTLQDVLCGGRGSKPSRVEFTKALEAHKIFLSEQQIRRLVNMIEDDTIDEFFLKVRGTLSQRRREIVDMAFQQADRDGSGVLTRADVEARFNSEQAPKVLSRTVRPADMTSEFIASFEGLRSADGRITLSEFEDYYAFVGASIPSDSEFVALIENQWRISEVSRDKLDTDSLEKLLIERLNAKASSPMESERVSYRRVFGYVDLDGSGFVTPRELREVLKVLNVTISESKLEMLFERFDADKCGRVSIDEFIDRLVAVRDEIATSFRSSLKRTVLM